VLTDNHAVRSQVGNVLIIPLVTFDLLSNMAAPYKITMVCSMRACLVGLRLGACLVPFVSSLLSLIGLSLVLPRIMTH
jgi:hypothetical protein